MNPDKLRRIRRLASVKCVDDRGPHTFAGARKVADAAAYRPVGVAQWFAVLDDGTERPLVGADEPAAAVPVAQAQPVAQVQPVAQAAPSPDAASLTIELALRYGDKSAERVAKAYESAYREAGKSWANVVEPLARVLQALAGRVETLEKELGERPHLLPMEDDEPAEANQLDEMAQAVMVGVAQSVMAGAVKA